MGVVKVRAANWQHLETRVRNLKTGDRYSDGSSLAAAASDWMPRVDWTRGRGADLTNKEGSMVVGATAAALVIGFLAGLLAFRAKSRWCPRCGSLTSAAVPEPRHGEGASACPPKR